jgi:hypothetical protein
VYETGGTTWSPPSPLASVFELPAARILSEVPVRFLLVAGTRDDMEWGVVGAIWLDLEGLNGGCLISPGAIWSGSEMARNYKNALARGWTEDRIFSYWSDQIGASGDFMIDTEQRADALFQVARLVGTL